MLFPDIDRRNSADDQSLLGNDSDEYYTPLSIVVSTDSGTDCGAISRHTNTAPITTRKHKTDMVRATNGTEAAAHAKNKHNKMSEHNSKHHTKQTSNVSNTETRCNTNAGAWPLGLRRSTGTIERSQPPNGTHRSKISRSSLDSVTRAVQSRQTSSSASAKRKQRTHAKIHSDSSDINSEANLVIENMRNRECEMFRKISFNNGYFSTTGSSSSDHMYTTSDTNTVESTITHLHADHCRHSSKDTKQCSSKDKSPKTLHRRKCRSFPLANGIEHQSNAVTSNARAQHDIYATSERPQKQQPHIGQYTDNTECAASETNTYQNTRKITITIKTNVVPTGVSVSASESKRVHSKQISVPSGPCADNLCVSSESSEESDSSNGDSGGEHSASSDSSKNCQATHENDALHVDAVCNDSSSDDSSSFFSLSSSDVECVSESSQYFNCMSFTDLSASNDRSTECIGDVFKDHCVESDKKISEKMASAPKPLHDQRAKMMPLVQQKAKDPMILIEQQMSADRQISSTVKVDKKQLKRFKSDMRKRLQCQRIVDNSFSEEIFDKTINLERQADVSCSREVIDSIVLSLEEQSNACKTTKSHKLSKTNKSPKAVENLQIEQPKFVGDSFLFDKLHASPKCTGKSISRLLAHRLEQHTITNIRRNLLQNVAYAITEKDRKTKADKKRMVELPPIKPPRSFVASASSSPLSKQSFESSATVPIAELNKIELAQPMGFVVPAMATNKQPHASNIKGESPIGEAHSVHFGWTRPRSNFDNDSATMGQYVTADSVTIPSYHKCIPSHTDIPLKEDIDTVDSARNSNNEFAQFSANLKENRTTNYSTPIKLGITPHDNHTAQMSSVYATPAYETVKVCEKCHCNKSKSPKMLSSKTGRKIGKAALKRTKTLIGTSKKFLKKPLTKQPAKHDAVKAATFKGGDNTVCNNCDTTGANGHCDKRVDKSLNLTPKEVNRAHVALHESPTRTVNLSKLQLLKVDAGSQAWPNDKCAEVESTLDGEMYMTPMEEFDFERVVSEPVPQQQDTNSKNPRTLKRSPSKVISMLAKSSVNFFRPKHRADAKHVDLNESPHYYKANDYDELDHKVLLMNEVLAEMRKRIEMGQGSSNDDVDEQPIERPSSSAKKCLFRVRTVSTSSGDLLEDDGVVEKVTRIDLHDEPEPVYAEIIPQHATNNIASDTLYRSCLEDSKIDPAAIGDVKRSSVQLREVYINASANSKQPNKYIMVNNNPNILYATVNRSQSRQSTEQHSIGVTDGKPSNVSTSFESLDTSLIDGFAKSVQIELDECRHRMSGLMSTTNNNTSSQYVECDDKSQSGSDSLAASDMNSGCSSFYRRNRRIVGNMSGSDDLAAMLDAMSFDTIATDSYCESINRGNDLNSEIKDTITSLENMPSETGESSSLSHDFIANDVTFRTCRDTIDRSYDSNKVRLIHQFRV